MTTLETNELILSWLHQVDDVARCCTLLGIDENNAVDVFRERLRIMRIQLVQAQGRKA